ncbi:MAG: hypothetical protein K2X47_03540 [Bdellovibrionales bacterium]|nr:hypothetical protein [Bdellovibrionales bacterium]
MSLLKKLVFGLIVVSTFLSGNARRLMVMSAQAAEKGGQHAREGAGGSCG